MTKSSRRSGVGRQRPYPLGARRRGPCPVQVDRGRRRNLGGRTQAAAPRRGDGRPRGRLRRVLPAAAIQSSQIELAGRFSEFLDRLDAALHALAGPQTLGAWAGAHGRRRRAHGDSGARVMAAAPTRRDPGGDRRGPGRCRRAAPGERAAGISPQLFLGELRELLGHRLEGRPTRANFRSGHLTFCTLVPMRSVPHRVICLLGLDDGGFPRQSPRDGDNLLVAEPRRVTAIRGPRIANCCSTRCSPPRRR